ncbi:hypothetical protein [Mangrovimonas xylaniphaga]|uniref:hypothetical protein n=1 Tax=Mangrovimonas xylaniphaga TaxID=1645915 RepID=UPI0006B5B42E|nr:hypothetical protein [Mangrovimonas xylaniphaga]
MVLNSIERLLEKYDNGETSLREEAQLKAYFAQEDVPPHLESYKVMFQYFDATKQEQFTKDVPLKPKKYQLYRWISVAAVAVLMVSVYLLTDTKQGLESLSHDELMAYNQTVEALNLVSTKFNKGASSLNALSLVSQNLEKGVESMNYVGEFSETTNKIFNLSN